MSTIAWTAMPTKKGHKFIVHALFEKSMKDYMNTLVYMHTFEELLLFQ